MKIKAVALDIVGEAKQWLDRYGNEDHMELCEIVTLEDDSPIPVQDLPKYDNWDLLLVFELGTRDQVDVLLKKLGIPEDKVLYPFDQFGSLLPNWHLASYIFNDEMGRLLKYMSDRTEGKKYSLVSIPGYSYVNVSSDNIILHYMNMSRKNWSYGEMKIFYDLSAKYYKFSEDQELFCDIGANIGTTCIYFKKELDKDVRILAFEPSPENYKMLRVNALLNDLDISDHMFVKKGLSDVCSGGQLFYNPGNPGSSSVAIEKEGRIESIELVTFDSYLKENDIDPNSIKYMWIDVEGFEGRFLAGAEDTLSRINVPIFMEFVPQFYQGKEGEFDLLIGELKKHFRSFILAQQPDRGKLPIELLENERDNTSTEWDIFLLKE